MILSAVFILVLIYVLGDFLPVDDAPSVPE